ncbi:hypothetical protein A1O1_03431 [Capronia coronata CBS 617.96]|uniref:Uncharacterized protein n=1 Tax=Capronia coronata CBS 617.96 TaxID=1182541 RepID=W9YBW5_9EURO|nr:uncharacterized protein A1O1_03431 [Capronia coronata CBS 617.96]EXJ90332.1 hypothetical protein A1O1_03431 [Capronia coronata CBS 617.96]
MPSGDDKPPDLVRPTPKQASRVLRKSRRTWGGLLGQARSASGLPISCANINSLLHNTPALPSSAEVEEVVFRDKWVELGGFGVWGLGSTRCDLAGEVRNSSRTRVVIATRQPQYCTLSEEFGSNWTGFGGVRGKGSTGNYLSALVLGWSYVLSACLVELRRTSDSDTVLYTEAKALLLSDAKPVAESNGFVVPIGSADAAACRWWAAILAAGCGWQAVLHRSDYDYYPAWSCHLDDREQFKIHLDQPVDLSAFASACPPSSAQALQYLHDFARLHNVYDRLLAALTATLTIPEEKRHGVPVVLPRPGHALAASKKAQSTLFCMIPPERLLPHFMAFSCIFATGTTAF